MRGMNRGRLSVVAAITVALVAGGVAYASIPGPDGVISGCYKKIGGALRVIDAGAGVRCNATETSLNWNQTGPKGATGDRGPGGPPGPVGPTGPSNAFTDYEGGRQLDNGDEKTIVSVTLPIGHYTLSADAEFGDNLGTGGSGAEVACHWNSLATVHGLGSEGLGFLVDMPVLGDVNVTSDNTAVGLLCHDLGPDGVGMGGELIATRAGTITPAS